MTEILTASESNEPKKLERIIEKWHGSLSRGRNSANQD